jgi:hypothetical protein
MNYQLIRFAYTPFGVFGRLQYSKEKALYTVERPWLQNKRNISCIPVGTYPLKLERFHRGDYEAIGLQNVPERSQILIHIANTMNDVQGCIGVGNTLGYLTYYWAVQNSKISFDILMADFIEREKPVSLEISNLNEAGYIVS